MNFSTLAYGAMIGYVAYKVGERVERNRQINDDSTYGLTDLLDEIFDDFQNGNDLSSTTQTIRSILF